MQLRLCVLPQGLELLVLDFVRLSDHGLQLSLHCFELLTRDVARLSGDRFELDSHGGQPSVHRALVLFQLLEQRLSCSDQLLFVVGLKLINHLGLLLEGRVDLLFGLGGMLACELGHLLR